MIKVETTPGKIQRIVTRSTYALGIGLALAALVALLFPLINTARQAALRMEHANNLKQIGLGLLNYHDTYKAFPPAIVRDEAGRPLRSWRMTILPFVEMTYDLDRAERWDDPRNRWMSREPNQLYCWSSGSLPRRLETNVVALTGPGTLFEEGRRSVLGDMDGDLIVAVCVAESGLHWMEPGDLSIDETSPSLLQGFDGGGLHVLFADGSVWFLQAEASLDDVEKFFTRDGAKKYDREAVLRPYAR